MKTLDEILKTCEKGFCTFNLNDNLSFCTQNVPDGYGAYLFHANDEKGEVVYIGKSGTLKTDGSFCDQNLRERLNKKQEGEYRQQFLSKKIVSEKLKAIVIEWYILKDNDILPALFEAMLIQKYFEKNKTLPRWNNRF